MVGAVSALISALGQPGEILAAVEPSRTVRFRMLGVEIVDHDQVEIRRRRHLAAAELAERQHRRLLRRATRPWQLGEILPRSRGAASGSARIGEPRETPRRPARPTTVPERMRVPIRNMLLLREDADAIEEVLVAAGLLQRAVEPGAPARPPRAARRRSSDRSPRPSLREIARGCRPAAAPCRARARSARPDRGSAAAARTAARRRAARARKRSNASTAPRSDWPSGRNAGSASARVRRAARARRCLCSDRWPPASQPRTSADASSGCRKPIAASLSSVSRSSASAGKTGRAAWPPRPAHFRTASRSAAARCAGGRAAPRRTHRDRAKPQKAREPLQALAVAGSVWVCSSATICSRCSTERRKR